MTPVKKKWHNFEFDNQCLFRVIIIVYITFSVSPSTDVKLAHCLFGSPSEEDGIFLLDVVYPQS